MGVGGGEWGWVHCLIMPITKHLFMVQRNSHIFTMMYQQTCSPQINSLGVFTVVHKLLQVFNIVGWGNTNIKYGRINVKGMPLSHYVNNIYSLKISGA